MPSALDNESPPPTVDDFMDSSALAVSPILTASIFEELYTQTSTLDTDTLAISENSNPNLSRPRHHRRSHLAQQDTISYTPPPPSARWTRRLRRAASAVSTQEDDDDQTSSGDEERYDNHPGGTSSAFRTYGQNCLDDQAVNRDSLREIKDLDNNSMLDFDVIFDDGGQYGDMYGIENLLANDGSVYCSARKGTVNVLAQYCGYVESGLAADTTCTISTIIIKAPHVGFTAPCKDGLIFVSNSEIDVSATSKFDSFTREEYEAYVTNKITKNGLLEDTDPVACFSLKGDRLSIIDLNNRAGKYVLIKLLRSDFESDNIDMQYVGFIGHSGARSFGSAKLC